MWFWLQTRGSGDSLYPHQVRRGRPSFPTYSPAGTIRSSGARRPRTRHLPTLNWFHTRPCSSSREGRTEFLFPLKSTEVLRTGGGVEEIECKDLKWKRRGPEPASPGFPSEWKTCAPAFRLCFRTHNIHLFLRRAVPTAAMRNRKGNQNTSNMTNRLGGGEKSPRLFPDIHPPPSGTFSAHLCTFAPDNTGLQTHLHATGARVPFIRPPTF